MELPCFSLPRCLSIWTELSQIVLYVQDGAVNVGKIQLLKANQCLHLHAQALLISPGFGIVTPTEEMETLRTGTLK